MSGLTLYLDSPVAEVGGFVAGELHRAPDADGITDDSRARAVRLTLSYHTEGRGDEDSRSAPGLEFALEVHGGLQTRFELAVPGNSPISYDGRLLRVLWTLEARVDLKLARDPKIEASVVVVPRGGVSLYDRPHPLPSTIRPQR